MESERDPGHELLMAIHAVPHVRGSTLHWDGGIGFEVRVALDAMDWGARADVCQLVERYVADHMNEGSSAGVRFAIPEPTDFTYCRVPV